MKIRLPLVLLVLVLASLGTGDCALAGDERSAIDACLSKWEAHPFDNENPKYRVVSSKVKVFGVGGDVSETEPTDTAELVLIKSNVTVMGKATMNLLNPNGWYCLASKVNVMSKTTINLDCNAHIASSQEAVAVMGDGKKAGGVTVMGKAIIVRKNCGESMDE